MPSRTSSRMTNAAAISRILTLVFTDLADFSSWALEAGDDDTLALLRMVSEIIEPAVTQHRGRVVAARDPVAAALHRQMAVAVDHRRNDGGAARIDHLGSGGVRGIVGTDPRDLPILDGEADARPKRSRRSVGERRIVKDDPCHRRAMVCGTPPGLRRSVSRACARRKR